jgi:hypothetical protein
MRARKIYFRQPIQADLSCPVPGAKMLLFPIRRNCGWLLAFRADKGRIAIVTDVVRNAVDVKMLSDVQYRRGRRSRVVLAPQCLALNCR